mmetsp:Transcript_28534/g.68681  ORF Transcript_28534/g.68681 Transcript_28534/m.68681 type:complete len:237 (-) Transcript_28534:515-1225(-)
MFAVVVEILFLLWEAESAFVARNNFHWKRPTPPSEQYRYDICHGLHASNVASKVGLFVVSRENVPTNKGRKRCLPQTRKPLARPARERTVVIMYHKPPNVITSHSNADKVSHSSRRGLKGNARTTVYEDIYSMIGFISDIPSGESFEEATQIRSKLHAIGRLDADTTGLLLLTNDGALVHRITNPNAKIRDGLSSTNSSSVQKNLRSCYNGSPFPSDVFSTTNIRPQQHLHFTKHQ